MSDAERDIPRTPSHYEVVESLHREYEDRRAAYHKDIESLRTELASVTARLAAAEERLRISNEGIQRLAEVEADKRKIGWLGDSGRGNFEMYERACADEREAFIRIFTLGAAAVSAGWMKPLGEGGGE